MTWNVGELAHVGRWDAHVIDGVTILPPNRDHSGEVTGLFRAWAAMTTARTRVVLPSAKRSCARHGGPRGRTGKR